MDDNARVIAEALKWVHDSYATNSATQLSTKIQRIEIRSRDRAKHIERHILRSI